MMQLSMPVDARLLGLHLLHKDEGRDYAHFQGMEYEEEFGDCAFFDGFVGG